MVCLARICTLGRLERCWWRCLCPARGTLYLYNPAHHQSINMQLLLSFSLHSRPGRPRSSSVQLCSCAKSIFVWILPFPASWKGFSSVLSKQWLILPSCAFPVALMHWPGIRFVSLLSSFFFLLPPRAYWFPRVFGDEFGDEFGDSLNFVSKLVTHLVMISVNHCIW